MILCVTRVATEVTRAHQTSTHVAYIHSSFADDCWLMSEIRVLLME